MRLGELGVAPANSCKPGAVEPADTEIRETEAETNASLREDAAHSGPWAYGKSAKQPRATKRSGRLLALEANQLKLQRRASPEH